MELLDFVDDDRDEDVGVVAAAEGKLVVVVLHSSTLGISKLGGEGEVSPHLGVELLECKGGVDGFLLPPPPPPPPPDPEENIPPIPNLT